MLYDCELTKVNFCYRCRLKSLLPHEQIRLVVDKNNFSYLLVALLVLLFGIPLADDLAILSGPVVRAFLFSMLFVIGVWSLRGSGWFFLAGIAFVVVGILFNILAINSQSTIFLLGSFSSLFGFLFVSIACTLKQVAVGSEVSVNRLVGAVCVYLLLGTMWAVAYTVLDLLVPGSFQGFSSLDDFGRDSEWLYFSFVTMTTLGYGDITPVSAIARFLAYSQAIFGQFYVAILVAGLVSAYISSRQR